MDKYEFNIKVEQLKKMVNKEDYESAMKIADTIDWRRVRNANLLSMVADVYEKNGEYQDAKTVLLLAFERAPIGKRLLYKLSGLALKEHNVGEAEDYYREFCEIAPDDSRQYLLRYLILKEKGAQTEQLQHALEQYIKVELDEKWMYELAELYSQSGQIEKCIDVCDKLMLMFGIGKYIDKAVTLKQQYAPLTTYQQDLVDNRDKYEEKLRAVEEEYEEKSDTLNLEDLLGGTDEETPSSDVSVEEKTDEPAEEEKQEVSSETETEDISKAAEETLKEDPIIKSTLEEDLAAHLKEVEAEEKLAAELSKISGDSEKHPVEEDEEGQTKVLHSLKEALDVQSTQTPDTLKKADKKPETDVLVSAANHFMIEGKTPEKGLETAVSTLKKIHDKTGSSNGVAKINALKLNHKKLPELLEKLSGRDLIVEDAADLTPEAVKELEAFMDQMGSSVVVVLIDNPKQLERFHTQYPSLASRFECIGAEAEQPASRGRKKKKSESVKTDAKETVVKEQVEEKQEDTAKNAENEQAETETEAESETEMGIDEFAQYACKYAHEIDCSITGKSMLALYEKIEILEEDGVKLTKTAAEDLIEEAADRAEKPSLGKLIKNIFSSKYDKDGLLILKEEHFIGK